MCKRFWVGLVDKKDSCYLGHVGNSKHLNCQQIVFNLQKPQKRKNINLQKDIFLPRCLMSHSILNVLPKGSGFLDLLYDLGYLNDHLLRTINKRLLEEQPKDDFFSLNDIRKIAAQVIFENLSELNEETRKTLLKEWTYLFS